MKPEEIKLRLRLLDDRCLNSMRMAMSYYEEIITKVLSCPNLLHTRNKELGRLNVLRKELDSSITTWAANNNSHTHSGVPIPDEIRLKQKEQDFKSLNRVVVYMSHIRAEVSDAFSIKKDVNSNLVTAAMPTKTTHWLTVNGYISAVLRTKD